MGASQSVQPKVIDPIPFIQEAQQCTVKGQYQQARKLYLTALDALINMKGQEHIDVGRLQHKLGEVLLRQRLFMEAVTELRKAQTVFDKCRHNKQSEPPTLDEYRTLLNNIAC